MGKSMGLRQGAYLDLEGVPSTLSVVTAALNDAER